jgi:SAM-dependent methyltransferase
MVGQPTTPPSLSDMSYPDFVGFINQWNVLPGSYSTLSEWALFSRLGPESQLLQLGCTTGFQARELAVLSGCVAHGLDVSAMAVDTARHNAAHYTPSARVTYECCDALAFAPKTRYTHVALGGGLRFFPDPDAVIRRLPEWLVDGGHILASPFYIDGTVPPELLERGRQAFGVLPTTEGYDDVMAPYLDFEVLYESRKEMRVESEAQLQKYCQATIDRAAEYRGVTDAATKQALFDRLLEVRRTSNALRAYQGYSVMVLRYRAATYPHRYVELF